MLLNVQVEVISVNSKVIKRLIRYCKPYRFILLFIFILSTISVLLTLLTPVLFGQAIDLLIGINKVNMNALFIKLLVITIVIVLTALVQWLLGQLTNKITYNITNTLRNSVFEKIHLLPLKYLDRQPRGDIINRAINDIDLIGTGLLQSFTSLFTGIATIIGTILIMCLINLSIAIVVIVLTPLSLVVASIIVKRTHIYFKEQLDIRSEMNAYIEEMIGNQKLIKAYNYENIPENGLDKESVQLFLKRLRQRISLISDKQIRYIACGEYGGKTGRPHYHLIIWNFPFMEQFSEVQSIINDAWNYGDWIDDGKKWYYKVGFTMVKRCNFGSIYYVLKYMRKEQKIPPVFKNSTFFLSSRGGRKSSVQGIGSQWIYDNSLYFLTNPDVLSLQVVDKFTGKKFECYLPQYYLDKLLPRWSSMVNVNVPRALDLFLNSLSLKNAYEKVYSDKYGDYFSITNSQLDYKISEVILKYPHRLPCYNFTYCSHFDLKRITNRQVLFWEYYQNNLLLSVLSDYLLEDINFSYLDLKHNEEIRKSRQVSLSLLYQNEYKDIDDIKSLEQQVNLKNYIKSLKEIF